jgi:hypothetical protein
MHDCVISDIAWNGLLSCRTGTRVSLTGVTFKDIGGKQSEERHWASAAVWALHEAAVKLSHCELELSSMGLVISDNGTAQLADCVVTQCRRENVVAKRGAAVSLAGCTITGSSECCGLAVSNKGTFVEAQDTAFQENDLAGVYVTDKASVRLEKCMVRGNKRENMVATCAAAVYLAGCTVADSSMCSGLTVCDEGTCVEAQDTAFQGNCESGVLVADKARVRLVKCTASANRLSNVQARDSAAVSLACSTVADSLKGCGLAVWDEGTRVEVQDTAFRGNCTCGVDVAGKASVRLDKCTVSGNRLSNVHATGGAVVDLTGCTVTESSKGSGLVVWSEGTRVEAKESMFQGNHTHAVQVSAGNIARLDCCLFGANNIVNNNGGAFITVDGNFCASSGM